MPSVKRSGSTHVLSPLEAAAAGDDGPKLATFDVLAYTGAPMRLNGYRFPVILDLNGVKVASELEWLLERSSRGL